MTFRTSPVIHYPDLVTFDEDLISSFLDEVANRQRDKQSNKNRQKNRQQIEDYSRNLGQGQR